MIYVIRGQQVMLDQDLALLYQVETGRLNEAVKRNLSRFPDRYRFQLTRAEYNNLKSQSAISSLRSISTHGGRRTLPYAFTEQGIAMLSSVLHSNIAIQMSINQNIRNQLKRSFLKARSMMHSASSQALSERPDTALRKRYRTFQRSISPS